MIMNNTHHVQVRVIADAVYGVALLLLAVLLCSGDIVSAGSWTITCCHRLYCAGCTTSVRSTKL